MITSTNNNPSTCDYSNKNAMVSNNKSNLNSNILGLEASSNLSTEPGCETSDITKVRLKEINSYKNLIRSDTEKPYVSNSYNSQSNLSSLNNAVYPSSAACEAAKANEIPINLNPDNNSNFKLKKIAKIKNHKKIKGDKYIDD